MLTAAIRYKVFLDYDGVNGSLYSLVYIQRRPGARFGFKVLSLCDLIAKARLVVMINNVQESLSYVTRSLNVVRPKNAPKH